MVAKPIGLPDLGVSQYVLGLGTQYNVDIYLGKVGRDGIASIEFRLQSSDASKDPRAVTSYFTCALHIGGT